MVTPVITALIGLGGVILGAVATLLSPALTDRRQARVETRRWRRDQLAMAYQQVQRYLLRAANRRSEFEGGRGGAVLNSEHQREWFDDIVEAQIWLRAVVQYCSPSQVNKLQREVDLLDRYVDRLVSGVPFERKGFNIWAALQLCLATVSECARSDGLDTAAGLRRRDVGTPPRVSTFKSRRRVGIFDDRRLDDDFDRVVPPGSIGATNSNIIMAVKEAPERQEGPDPGPIPSTVPGLFSDRRRRKI